MVRSLYRLFAALACLCVLGTPAPARAQATDASRAAFAAARGTQDPFDLLARAVNANPSHFLSELTGLVTIAVTGTSVAGNGASYTVSGTINLPSARTALAANTAAAAGTRALFRKTLQSSTSLLNQVNLPSASSLPFTLTFAGGADNASGSITAALVLVNGKFQTPALRTIGTQLGATSLSLQLGVSKVATAPVTLSAGVTGDLFLLPSAEDNWLLLQPAVTLDSGGGLTVGSTVSGSCGTRNLDTVLANPAGCSAAWDVFGLGMLSTKGGSLYPTFDATTGSLSAVSADIRDGKLGGVLNVAGAMVVDTDLTPGAGLVLNTTTNSTGISDAINALSGRANTPAFNKIKTGISKIPGLSNVKFSQAMQVVIAPFGFVYGNYNYPGATYKYAMSVNSGGAVLGFNQELKGDVVQILRGTGGTPQGTMSITANFTNVYNAVVNELKKVGWLGEVLSQAITTFQFNGGSATVGMNLAQGAEATGRLDFKVFGAAFTPSVALDILFNPVSNLIELVKDQAKIEIKKIFGMCDPTDVECQRKNRKCTQYNTGYGCITQGWGGSCTARSTGIDRYVCVSPEKEQYDEAKNRKCTQYNTGYSCYRGDTPGKCSARIPGAIDHYQCR